jgi:hypothetical protein
MNQQKAEQHSDDVAIDMFAKVMKEKMAKKRADGRDGWEFCTADTLSSMLHAHVRKGDPVDVANFCMMLWYGRNGIAPEAQPVAHAPDCPAEIARDLYSKMVDECAASGASCSYANEGPNGESQCRYCGKARPTLFPGDIIATSEVQVPPMTQKNLLTNSEAVIGKGDWLMRALGRTVEPPKEPE